MKLAVTDVDIYHEWIGRFEDAHLDPMLVSMQVEVEGRLSNGMTLSGTVDLLPDELDALKAVLDRIAERVSENANELLAHSSGPVWTMR